MRRRITNTVLLAVLVILVVLVVAPVITSWPREKFMASVLPSVLVSLTNNQREANNLPDLAISPLLTQAAQAKADDMAARGYFSHTDPVTGEAPWVWLAQAGYLYRSAGENLAVNFSDSEDVIRAWAKSPTHYANLVRSDFTEVGIGIARGQYKGRSSFFIVQFFGRPLIESAAVPPTVPRQTASLALVNWWLLPHFVRSLILTVSAALAGVLTWFSRRLSARRYRRS